jgi:uncharacterized protein (TIGR03086 family)
VSGSANCTVAGATSCCWSDAAREPVRGCHHRHVRENDVFVLADQALNRVVQQIADDQWSIVVPASFVRISPGDTPPELRTIIKHHASDDAWVPDTLSGRTMDEVGKDKFAGDLLGDDPKAAFAAIVDTSCATASQFDDLERTVHLSFGDYTAREYFWQINFFRGMRAHEIAKLIGADPTLPDDLVQGLWDEVGPVAEVWRKIGVFGPAIPVPDDAPLMQRLLGVTGRDPG